MKQALVSWVRRGVPFRAVDVARGGGGALVGVALVGAAMTALSLRWPVMTLAPSVGASAVLVFCIPASPLAQPRAVIGGNLVSAAIGLACGLLLPHALAASALAVGLAIAAMLILGCLHPPGGGVAITGALAAIASREAAAGPVLIPLATCSLLLVLAAIVWMRLTGRTYPHRVEARPNVHATRDAPPGERAGFTPADLDSALTHYGELLDVSREDLDALFRQVELQAHRRIHTQILSGEIMSRDVISVDVNQSADTALAWLRDHDLRTAPVLDEFGHVVGVVRRAELQAARSRTVGAVLDPFVHKVRPSTPIQALLPVLSSGAAHEVMVVDAERRLLGMITQTDLLAVLYRAHIVEAIARPGGAGA